MPRRGLALLLAVCLCACTVMPPTQPAVMVVPAAGKDLPRFESEDHFCRRRAYDHVLQTRGPELASSSATGSVLLTAITGLAAGALLGSLVGKVGVGALIGAGYGGALGAAVGGSQANAAEAGMQYEFDRSYVQCMYGYGNHLAP
jgi:hypothetical protein